MTDFQVFFLFVLPLVIALMCGIVFLSTRSGFYDDSQKGPQVEDTFEEMNDD